LTWRGDTKLEERGLGWGGEKEKEGKKKEGRGTEESKEEKEERFKE
jgi:hypothetical protein